MGEMGVLPVSTNAEVTPENVGCLSAQTAEMINTGHGAASLQYYTPEIVRPQIGEWMSGLWHADVQQHLQQIEASHD